MSTQSSDPDDHLDIWEPPVYDDIELAHLQNQRGLVIYQPGYLNGTRYVRSDCFVDTYDVR